MTSTAAGQPYAAVEARQLVKRYGVITAVDGVSFEVARGEIFGFLGANGLLQPGLSRTLGTEGILVNADSGGVQPLGLVVSRERVCPQHGHLCLDLGTEAIGEGLGAGQQPVGSGAWLLRSADRVDRGLVQRFWRGGHRTNGPIGSDTFTRPVHARPGSDPPAACVRRLQPQSAGVPRLASGRPDVADPAG